MSFSQQRAQISAELTNIESVQDYKRVYLTSAVVRSIEHLNKKFVNIRAGKASPAMVGSVMVNY